MLDITHSYHFSGFYKVSDRSAFLNLSAKPVNFVNTHRVIDLYDLPYMDVVMLIPQEMRLHLTKHNIQALSPHVRCSRYDFCEQADGFGWVQFPPKTKLLHTLSSRMTKRISVNYRILIPEANAAPILWRAVRALAGSGTF